MFWKLVTPELLESLPDGIYRALDSDKFTVIVKITSGQPDKKIKWIYNEKSFKK
jgi:hypothetical protein